MFSLAGKRALITGATGGIGTAIAHCLYAQGAQIGLVGRNLKILEKISQELPNLTTIFHSNFLEPEGPKHLIQDVIRSWGGIDILINNAAVTQDRLIARMKDEDWDQVMQVNLRSVFQLCRESLRGMLAQRSGRIVNISSIVGFTGNPGQTNYVASKAGLVGFSKALAMEIASRNITVNVVAPGFIQTSMTDALPPERAQRLKDAIPLGRAGLPEEVAAGVLFLVSPEASYITGQTLHINGGAAMI